MGETEEQIVSRQEDLSVIELAVWGGGDFPVMGGVQAGAQGAVCGSFSQGQKTVMIPKSLGS